MEPTDWKSVGREALVFFSRITASCTHELKNCLAVMNEQGNLLLELMEAASDGREVPQSKLTDKARRLVARVEETDRIIRRLNSFSHLADEDVAGLEAGGLLDLMVAMYRRLAQLAGVTLDLREGGEPLPLLANPYLLGQALFACLEQAAGACGPGSTLTVWVEPDAGGARFSFAPAGEGGGRPAAGPSPGVLGALGARTSWDPAGVLQFWTPKRPPGLASLKKDADGAVETLLI
ncbi:MAG: hypothetical protein KQJ78_12835 [Deltaproteobacteria bacterium]|nr:hypothetical protein [Deltaproteobacteria bacterium]